MTDFILDKTIFLFMISILGLLWWIAKTERWQAQQAWLYMIAGLLLVFLSNITNIVFDLNDIKTYIDLSEQLNQTYLGKIAGFIIGYILIFIGFRYRQANIDTAGQKENQVLETGKLGIPKQVYSHNPHKKSEEYHQLLAELTNNEKQLNLFLENLPIPTIVADLEDGKIIFINDNTELLLNSEKPAILGKKLEDIFFEEKDTIFIKDRLQSKGYLSNYELKIKKSDRSFCEVSISANSLIYKDNKVCLFVLTDISDRDRAKMNALLAAAVEYAGEAIEIVDTEAKLEYVNPAFEKITGYTRNEVLGKTPASFLRSDKHDRAFYDSIWTTISSGQVWSGCLIGKTKNETLCYQEVTFSPVPNADGIISHYIGVRRDVTQRKQIEEERQRLFALVENSSDFIALSSLEGELIYVNAAGRKLVGLDSLEEALSRDIADYFPAEAFAYFCEITLPALKTKGRCETESQLRHFKTNQLIEVHRSCFMVRHPQSGEPICMATVQRDITERKRQEERLRLLERAITASRNGIVIADAEQPDQPLVYVNPGFEQMTGYSAAEVIGKNCRFLQGDDRDQEALDDLRAAIDKGIDCSLVVRNYRKDGTLFWNELRISPVHNASGRLTHFVGIQTDITDRKLTEEQLIHNAFHDALTGLPNRSLFTDRLGQAISRAKRHKDYVFAVLFIDLDRFKIINDSLGHPIGDRLLMAIARRLEKCLRVEDTVARLGGDEFTILLDGINDKFDATRIAERIHQELALPFHLKEYEIFVSASIGIVLSSSSYEWSGDLLRDADIAMYHAKMNGKAQHAVFDRDMHDNAVTRLQMETDLRWAIEREEFLIHYQPIISIATGQITGFEALVRWQHPEYGLIPPGEFIPIAEESGLLIAIDYYVLREACRQVSIWQRQFTTNKPLTLSANLSTKQFLQPDLVQAIDNILQATNFEPKNLNLEITEGALLESDESVTKTLLQLKNRNIRLSIDDFGTGYSCLSYLHQLPINTLKIDRSFIGRIGLNGKNSEIVQAIITLAHQLGLSVTAEGVETMQQLQQLQSLKCEFGQGYLFSKPLNAQAAQKLLAEHQLNINLT